MRWRPLFLRKDRLRANKEGTELTNSTRNRNRNRNVSAAGKGLAVKVLEVRL